MSRNSEMVNRIKRLKAVQSQSEFAEEVGIPQPRLSQFERGIEPPPVKALIKFARFAFAQGWAGDALWFLEKAGLDTDVLIEMSLLPGQNARDSSASGVLIENVLPHPRVTEEGKRVDSANLVRALPAWMVPKKGTTFYVEATDDFIVPFNRGDLILVDSSEVNQAELLGSYVVAYRPNHFSDAERLKLQDHFMGSASPEEIKRRRERSQFPFLRTGVLVGRLIMGGTFGTTRGIEIRTKVGDTLFEALTPDTHEMLVPGTDAEREAIDQMARKAASSSLGHASRKNKSTVQLYTDLQILGRAIGWLPAPIRDSRDEPRGKSKKQA